MTFTEQDRQHMRRALELAAQARGLAEPNPPVGAVLVREGRVIGEGHTQRFGGPHAEVMALRDAADQCRGATMYVTLEPCAHEGKTPPCAGALVEAGLKRVVVAVLDPTPKTRGRGVALLREAGLQVDVGLCRQESVRAKAAFFKRAATGRPLVTAKWAMTADGKTATRTGSSRWISSAPARRVVHQLRGIVDCVAVGSRTAQRDDPLLTCRMAEPRRMASRLVLCGRGCPAADSRLVQTCEEAPVLLAYPEEHPPDGLEELLARGCQGLPVPAAHGFPRRVDPPALLDELGRRGVSNVLLEGGAEVLGSFFDAGQVDRVMAFVAPKITGGERAVTAVGGRGIERMEEALPLRECAVRTVGPDVLIEGWINDPVQWLPEA